MDRFGKFLATNGLKKGQIASFLGVSPAFVTQLSAGSRQVPADKLAKIKANKAWDTSMFTETTGVPVVSMVKKGDKITPIVEIVKPTSNDGYIRRLKEELDEVKAERDALLQEVAVLKYQLTQKEEVAPSAGDSLSANAI